MAGYYQLIYGDEGDGWHLNIRESFPDGSPTDIWAYRGGRRFDQPKTIPLAISVNGNRLDYYRTAFGTIVVSKRLADLFGRMAERDIQRIPANVDGDEANWEVITITSCVDCIDHSRSSITYYPKRHPEKAGKPSGVLRLILDPERVGVHAIFQPIDWEVATIVSEAVKCEMEKMKITGVGYRSVT